MTIKELQEAKIKLDKELTDSVRGIVDSFYKTNGVAPSGITVSIKLIEVKIDTEAKPITPQDREKLRIPVYNYIL